MNCVLRGHSFFKVKLLYEGGACPLRPPLEPTGRFQTSAQANAYSVRLARVAVSLRSTVSPALKKLWRVTLKQKPACWGVKRRYA